MAEEAIDLPEARREVLERESAYQQTNLAKLDLEDPLTTTLFKMYETHKHINDKLSVFES